MKQWYETTILQKKNFSKRNILNWAGTFQRDMHGVEISVHLQYEQVPVGEG